MNDQTNSPLLQEHKFSTQSLRKQFENAFDSNASDLCANFPISEYIEAFDQKSGFGGYRAIPDKTSAFCNEIAKVYGDSALGNYHRLVLLQLIDQFEKRSSKHNYPPEVLECFEKHVYGILRSMNFASDLSYMHQKDRFSKDLAVCRHKLVPCGAQMVDICSGIPRSVALRGGVVQLIQFSLFMLLRAKGFRVFYEMHMDSRLIRDFNARGWERCYIRIAKMLIANPKIKGVCGSSWWFDPKIKELTPRLYFLQEIPIEGGAALFNAGTNETCKSDALVNSPERQQAYDEGSYLPANYSIVWTRNDLISWAKNRSL